MKDQLSILPLEDIREFTPWGKLVHRSARRAVRKYRMSPREVSRPRYFGYDASNFPRNRRERSAVRHEPREVIVFWEEETTPRITAEQRWQSAPALDPRRSETNRPRPIIPAASVSSGWLQRVR